MTTRKEPMTPNELAHALDELREYLLDAAPHLRMLRVAAQTLRELAHALDELREYLLDAVPHLPPLRELQPPDQTVRMKNLERVARSFIDDVEWQGASHNEEAYRQRAIAKHLLGDV